MANHKSAVELKDTEFVIAAVTPKISRMFTIYLLVIFFEDFTLLNLGLSSQGTKCPRGLMYSPINKATLHDSQLKFNNER